MDISLAVKEYFTKVVSCTSGLKVLIVDNDTVATISLVKKQSDIRKDEVYLVRRLADFNGRDGCITMKAIVLVRPSEENLQLLEQELLHPKHGEYYLFFTNHLPKDGLDRLALADASHVVKKLTEMYVDFLPLNAGLFSLNMERCNVPQLCDGLYSALMCMRMWPLIRYEKKSPVCCEVAEEMMKRLETNAPYFAGKPGMESNADGQPPLLLIVDRKDDPVTPLLTQWTYQAMVHELMGIKNNRVDMSGVKDRHKTIPSQVVLSRLFDEFFGDAMFSDFGDLGERIKELVEKYQETTRKNEQIQSLSDVKRFIQEYDSFTSLSGSVSLHVALMSHLSKVVHDRSLMAISEVEQDLVAGDSHDAIVTRVHDVIMDGTLDRFDRLRMALLYALRYETKRGTLQTLIPWMEDAGLGEDVGVMKSALKMVGCAERSSDLFGNQTFIEAAKRKARRGLKGVSSVYMQHETLLETVLRRLRGGRLSTSLFPWQSGRSSKSIPSDIVVFYCGGVTYEESRTAALFEQATGLRVLVGGTRVWSAREFVDYLRAGE